MAKVLPKLAPGNDDDDLGVIENGDRTNRALAVSAMFVTIRDTKLSFVADGGANDAEVGMSGRLGAPF